MLFPLIEILFYKIVYDVIYYEITKRYKAVFCMKEMKEYERRQGSALSIQNNLNNNSSHQLTGNTYQ